MTPTGCAFQTSTHSYCRRRASGCKSKPWEPNSGQKVKGPQGTWLTNFSWPPSQTNVYIRNGTLTSMVSSLGVRYSKAFIDIYTQDTYSITFRNTLCGLISPPLHCPLTSEKVEIQARMQTHLHGGRLGSFPSGLGGGGGSVSYSAWPGADATGGVRVGVQGRLQCQAWAAWCADDHVSSSSAPVRAQHARQWPEGHTVKVQQNPPPPQTSSLFWKMIL